MPKPIGDTNIGKYFLIPTEWLLMGEHNEGEGGELRPAAIIFLVLLGMGFIWGVSYVQDKLFPQDKHLITINWNTNPVPDPNYVFKGAPTWPEE